MYTSMIRVANDLGLPYSSQGKCYKFKASSARRRAGLMGRKGFPIQEVLGSDNTSILGTADYPSSLYKNQDTPSQMDDVFAP